MCGIVGFAHPRRGADRAELVRRRDALTHRGPDDAGEWWAEDGSVGLAHRRLAILDLSPTGRQPMGNAGGTVRIVFNGEIYNHRELRSELMEAGRVFRGTSDTEVLLQGYEAWADGMLDRIEGMFAFALYDARRRRLLLARDRTGEKPLFYRHDDGELAFASELKALLSASDRAPVVDRDALDFFLAYGYVPGGRCLVAGFHKLPPAHAMAYDLERDRLTTWRYWTLPQPASERMSEPEAIEELGRLLEASVRQRLVADVPVGVLLSGGLDSSLVTAVAAGVSAQPMRTFTVAFPGAAAFDEGPHARLVAEHFGTAHQELVPDQASVDLLPELARQFDEPIGDQSMVPTYLLSREVRRHVTVALGGDGGDELFGGYPHYCYLQRIEALRRYVPAPARSLVAAVAANGVPVGTRGRNHLIGLAGDYAASLAHVNVFFDRAARERLLVADGAPAPRASAPEEYKSGLCDPSLSPLQQATRLDFVTTLPDDYLVKTDRASMRASLELRAPFLDRRLVEFAFSRLPDHLRATSSERKVLLRRFARRLLPGALDIERKHGFTVPLADWLRGAWGPFVREVLDGVDPRLFSRPFVRDLLEGESRGRANSHRIFALTMLELWRREYGVDVPR
jgi:asparagine synthase (glutamine-hydrolysing)